jgi:hypothetical protein
VVGPRRIAAEGTMTDRRTGRLASAAILTLLLAAGCDLKLNGDDDTLDAAAMEDFLTANFANVPNIIEALERLVETASGSPQPGVTIIPTATGVQGTLAIDLDGDGTRERTVAGSITFNNPQLGVAGGGTLVISGITGGSAQIGANTQVRLIGSSIIEFGPGSGFFRTAGGTQVALPEMLFTVQQGASAPVILGYMDFDGGNTSGTMLFESGGTAGWFIRVTGGDFPEFTVP